MSLVEWNNRAVEAEAELRCVADERADVERRTEAKAQAIRRHKDGVKKDKAALTRKLQDLEKDALGLAERTEAATKARDTAEAEYHGAMNAYESLHDSVKAIKAMEAAIAARPDLERQLETASVQWADEEHSLRTALTGAEHRYKEQRRGNKERIAGLEGRVRALEAALAADREARRAEGWEGPEGATLPLAADHRRQHDGEDGAGENVVAPRTSTSKSGASRKRASSPLRDRTNAQQ